MTGALQFEPRVRPVASGGTRSASGDAVVVRDADAVTLLVAAATSYPYLRGRARRSSRARRSGTRSQVAEAGAYRRARAWGSETTTIRSCRAVFPVRCATC